MGVHKTETQFSLHIKEKKRNQIYSRKAQKTRVVYVLEIKVLKVRKWRTFSLRLLCHFGFGTLTCQCFVEIIFKRSQEDVVQISCGFTAEMLTHACFSMYCRDDMTEQTVF